MGAIANLKPAHPMDAPQIARFGAYEINLGTGELRKSGVRVRLQEQPFQVLAALLESPGELVTREELQSRLWPDSVQGDFEQGLNKAVNKLRNALSDSADNPRFVETLARRGYRFSAPVIFPEGRGGGSVSLVSPGKALKESEKTERVAPPPPPAAHVPEAEQGPSLAPDGFLPVEPDFGELASFRNSGAAALGTRLAANRTSSVPPPRQVRPRVSTAWRTIIVLMPILLIFMVFVGIFFGLQALKSLQSLKGGGTPPRVPAGMDSSSGVVERWSMAESRFVPLEPALSGDGVTFTSDGDWLAFVGYPSAQLFVMRREGGATMAMAPGIFERTYTPAWSPDGQRLAFAGRKADGPWKVYVINRDGTGLLEINPGPGTEADPTWSPDGKTLALAPFPWETREQGTGVFLVEVDSGVIREVPGSRGHFSPRWSPDGRYLAALTEDESRLAMYDFATEKWTTVTGGGVVHPVWDSRGTSVYFLAAGRVQRFTPSTGKLESVLSVDGLELRSNSPFGEHAAPWVGLTPRDEILLLRAGTPD